jgi:hypothetical protein
MMNVSSYIFQSPYPQQVQFGRPDPVAESQQKADENTRQLGATKSATQQQSETYEYGTVSQTGSSVNVAASSTDTGVSASLSAFTTVNSQIQAAAAYSA